MAVIGFKGLLLGLIVGLQVKKDAISRGMNGVAWGLFVAFLLIIGLPAYFILRKPKLENKQ